MADKTLEIVSDELIQFRGRSTDYDSLLDSIGKARLVLLGEATHGTREFYHARAHITRQLIQEKGFHAVVVEADWPDAYRLNRYVRGAGDDRSAEEALGDFKRFPAWMWRNHDVVEFVDWLRQHNASVGSGQKVGFYGMDLYSLYTSMQRVVEYLEGTDFEAAQRARYRYSCFEDAAEDPQAYGYAAAFDISAACEEEVVGQLREMVRHSAEMYTRDGQAVEDEAFAAEQNARLVQNAEAYYREMFRGRVSSWNLRDQHMVETIEALAEHLNRTHGQTKMVVWAHNSHLGDAKATDMHDQGELNVGQLCREKLGFDVFSVGLTTHAGTVTAASHWGGPAERKEIVPSLVGSYERLFHETHVPEFLLLLRDGNQVNRALREEYLERAIGVIYRPESERISHYFHASLAKQFDAVIHFDESSAVEPLETFAELPKAEAPETYPTGV